MISKLTFVLAAFVLVVTPAQAQDREVPYWATLRASEINLRVGPSADYRIEWVYRRPGLPVKVIRVMDGWRLIEDPDGTRGWVASRLLSPDLGVIVVGKGNATIHEDADASSKIKWRLEPGVVGALKDCASGWCEITIGNRRGWVRANRLWGDGKP
ncbi:hypothetical protein LCM19_03565 [Qipengyuania flava]|uniref:SH3 domain-containing protein n=1 Tax=Qipengyuania sp. NPDC077563 TaxID=3364497 RepID=UPI001CD2DF1C|nr:hypothetical protein [Qipengyuania flava]